MKDNDFRRGREIIGNNGFELRCLQCNRKQIIHVRRTDSYYCRQCGYEWKREVSPSKV